MVIGRLGSYQRFSRNLDQLISSQSSFAKDTTRLNTGQRYLNNYDAMDGNKSLIQVTGRLINSNQIVENQSRAATELELAESSLSSIKELLDQIKQDAIQGSSETSAASDLQVFGVQLRNLGENLFQQANLKIGNKYLFGGIQSDIPVVTHTAGSLFGNAIYKEGASDLGERVLGDVQSSISLSEVFNSSESAASITGSSFTTLTANAELNLIVNDGTQEYMLGDIALASGDDITAVITKINTAFTAAGGTGSIVSNDGGALKFDTSLITGNKQNDAASIIISPGSNLPNSLGSLGLSQSSASGTSGSIIDTLAKLDEAYNSGDSETIRETIIDIDANIERLINAQAKLGNLVNRLEEASFFNTENGELLKEQQVDLAQLPAAEAIQKVNAAQASLSAILRSSSQMMDLSIFDFIGF